MSFHERHTLIQALLFSLAVHAALLLGVVAEFRPQAGVPATTMNVVIHQKQVPAAISPAAQAPEVPRVNRETPPKSAPRAEARKEAPVQAKRAKSRPEPEQARIAAREAAPLVVPAPVVAASVSDADAAPSTSTPVVVSASTSAPTVGNVADFQAGVSADDLRQYRVSLASAARRFKRYPALARERGWEGTAEVAIRFVSTLPAPDVAVVRSSGHDLLDEQAVQMVAQAARAIALPDGLRGRDLEIRFPVKFSLDEAP